MKREGELKIEREKGDKRGRREGREGMREGREGRKEERLPLPPPHNPCITSLNNQNSSIGL